MSGRDYINHGRRHREGGSDSIPLSNFGYPALYDIPIFTWQSGQDSANWSAVTIDSACVNNARRTNGGSINSYFVEHLRLGPYGSRWSVSVRHTTGPDHGILLFYWGTANENGSEAEGWVDPLGLLQASSATSPPVDYVAFDAVGVGGRIDAYNPVGSKDNFTPSRSEFRILGQPRDQLTAFGVSSPDGVSSGADGGPGIWNLKLLVSSKNASSSGYEFGISELRVQRIDELGF